MAWRPQDFLSENMKHQKFQKTNQAFLFLQGVCIFSDLSDFVCKDKSETKHDQPCFLKQFNVFVFGCFRFPERKSLGSGEVDPG